MSATPPASTGLKYSDYTTLASFATGSITAASLTGILSPQAAAPVAGLASLITIILIPITRYLQSKGD